MGGGRETSQDRDKASGLRITVYPSEIHEYTYCPRLYFFNTHIGKDHTLRERLRLALGRLFHLAKSIPDRLQGMKVEETREAWLGNVRLRGRPDSYTVEGDTLRVVERKSGRSPRSGAWISDVLQATAYTVILSGGTIRDAVIEVHYRDGKRVVRVNEDLIGFLTDTIDEIVLVKLHGIVPAPLRSDRKCTRCAFRDICYSLDEDLPQANLYEPGAWLGARRTVRSL